MRARLKWILLAFGFAAFGLLLRALTRPMGFGDAETYLQMAQRVGEFTISPHGYRILIPYLAAFLANLTAFPLPDTFLFLTLFAFVGVNVTIIFWFHKLLALPLGTALLLAALYTFSYAGIYHLHNAVHIGYWEHWFLLIGFIAIYHQRFWVLAGTVLISVWIKETIVLLFPLYFVSVWRAQGLRVALFRSALLCSIFLAMFLFLRGGWLLRGAQGLSSYSNFYSFDYVRFVMDGWKQINPIKEIYFAFQLLWLLALFGWFHAPTRARWMALLIPLAISQFFLATDTQRMTVLAFPAILLLVSFLLKQLSWAEQFFLATLNPLVFLLYNQHNRYLLFFTVWALGWLGLWYATRMRVPHLRVLEKILQRVRLASERTLWLGAGMTCAGIGGLIVLDTFVQQGGSFGLALALCGSALAFLNMLARGAPPRGVRHIFG